MKVILRDDVENWGLPAILSRLLMVMPAISYSAKSGVPATKGNVRSIDEIKNRSSSVRIKERKRPSVKKIASKSSPDCRGPDRRGRQGLRFCDCWQYRYSSGEAGV